MPYNSPAYCKKCRLVVAQYDPDRVQKQLFVYHGKCWKELLNEEEYVLNCLARPVNVPNWVKKV